MRNTTKFYSKQEKLLNAEQIIGLIPDDLLDQFSIETGVDSFVKKFHGKIIFKLFIYAMLTSKTISLRILETIFASHRFQQLFNLPKSKLTHAGIAYRLKTMDVSYVERIFSHLIATPEVETIFFADKRVNIRKIDSSVVTISSKLLNFGMNNVPGKKSIKFGVEINKGIPVNIILFAKQKHCSEDNVLPEMICAKCQKDTVNIAIFDRGVMRKRTFVELEKKSILFISRTRMQTFKVLEKASVSTSESETDTLIILSDQTVIFSNTYETFEQKLRLIKGVSKETGKEISFLTNVTFLSAKEITELYRSRWEIETFFKFIKQELNFRHLLSRSENGVRVVMYLTMIVAILLTIYKRVNRIVGWTSTKIKFLDELEYDILLSWHETLSPMFKSIHQKNALLRGG